jgi:hypothetical protein
VLARGEPHGVANGLRDRDGVVASHREGDRQLVAHRPPRRVQAPLTCAGSAPDQAAAATAEGDREAALAVRRRAGSEQARAAWARALSAYQRACAAGDDGALERQAIPLFRLGRIVEAAGSLDAYLARHPIDSFESALRARIQANQRAIERVSATVELTLEPAEAEVVVGMHRAGRGPSVVARAVAGAPVAIEVRSPGRLPHREVLTLEPGERRALAVRLDPIPGVPARAVVGPSTRTVTAVRRAGAMLVVPRVQL